MYFSPPRLAAEARPVRPRVEAVRTAQCLCFDFMVTLLFLPWESGESGDERRFEPQRRKGR